MKKAAWLLLAIWMGIAPGCVSQKRSAEFTFGNKMAREGLWKEAIYRWQRALKIEPGRAAIHNNLAVAYEHEGQWQKAEASYQEALRLAPHDSLIQANYSRFKKTREEKNHGL